MNTVLNGAPGGILGYGKVKWLATDMSFYKENQLIKSQLSACPLCLLFPPGVMGVAPALLPERPLKFSSA